MNPKTLTPLLLVEEWLKENGYERDPRDTVVDSLPEKNYIIDRLERILVRNKVDAIIIIRCTDIDSEVAAIKIGNYYWEPWKDILYNLHDPGVFNKLSKDFHL